MDVININKRILSGSKEIEIREDVIVPDSKPDLVSVLDINGNSYLYKINVEDGKIVFDGNFDSFLIYISSEQETRALNMSFKFGDSIENNLIKSNMTFKYNIDIVKSESKVLNERKVNVSCVLRINYEIFEIQKIDIYNEFENIEGIQLQSSQMLVNSLIGCNSNKVQIKEDIKVDDLDNIKEILKFNVQISNKETKVSYNKILAKAEANFSIIYITEDERTVNVKYTSPVMSFISLENIKDDSKCNIEYQIRNIFLKVNSSEEHSISCQIDFDVSCEAYESKQISIVSDLYSLKFNTTFDSKEIEVEKFNDSLDDKIVEIEERIEINDIKNIFEIQSESKILKNTISNDFSNVEGEVVLKLYYEEVNKMGLNIKNVVVPFITKIPASQNISTEVYSKEFDLNNNTVLVRLQLKVVDSNSKIEKIRTVENVVTEDLLSNNDYSMVIYFVKPNDTIWNISKSFNVSQDSIISLNNLENPDKINVGDRLYIVK